jgi:hypothetical protein
MLNFRMFLQLHLVVGMATALVSASDNEGSDREELDRASMFEALSTEIGCGCLQQDQPFAIAKLYFIKKPRGQWTMIPMGADEENRYSFLANEIKRPITHFGQRQVAVAVISQCRLITPAAGSL